MIDYDYNYPSKILCDYEYDYIKMCNQLQSITITIIIGPNPAFYKRWCSVKELGDSLTMVPCIVPGCSKRSGSDKVFFYRIPKIESGRGIKKQQLSK